jgi:hypothetical protein
MSVALRVAVVGLMLTAVRVGESLAAQYPLVFAIEIIVIALGARSEEEAFGRLIQDSGGQCNETDVANSLVHDTVKIIE